MYNQVEGSLNILLFDFFFKNPMWG